MIGDAFTLVIELCVFRPGDIAHSLLFSINNLIITVNVHLAIQMTLLTKISR